MRGGSWPSGIGTRDPRGGQNRVVRDDEIEALEILPPAVEDVLLRGAVEWETEGQVHVHPLKVGMDDPHSSVLQGRDPVEHGSGGVANVCNPHKVGADLHRLNMDAADGTDALEAGALEDVGEVVS